MRLLSYDTERGIYDEFAPQRVRSWVYFIQQGRDGPIKIGKATDPYSRMATLQSGCTVELRLLGVTPGGVREERAYQRQFAHLRIRGEWFQPGPDLLAILPQPD